MTSCADVRENISAYADNELDINERLAFEEHIKKCPACKEELEDMLRIIRICNDMPQQELPTGFKTELHEKLMAISARQEKVHVVPIKPKKKPIVRTLASIAAGMLLIFLGGSIVRFGLFSGGFSMKSADNAEMATQAPSAAPADAAGASEDDASYSLNAMSDTTGAMMEPADKESRKEDADYGIMRYEKPLDTPSKSFGVDRSEAMEARDNGAYKMNNEAASSKSSVVTITANDTGVILGKVTVLASVNNAMLPFDNVVKDGLQYSASITEVPATQDKDKSQIQLHYIFTEDDYSAFTSALNETFGAADVHIGAFVSEDMTDTMNMLIDQSIWYDTAIQELQVNNAVKNTDEISKLKKEMESIDNQIETIRLNSDFVTVTVNINLK